MRHCPAPDADTSCCWRCGSTRSNLSLWGSLALEQLFEKAADGCLQNTYALQDPYKLASSHVVEVQPGIHVIECITKEDNRREKQPQPSTKGVGNSSSEHWVIFNFTTLSTALLVFACVYGIASLVCHAEMRIGLSKNVTVVGGALWKAHCAQRMSVESLTLRTLVFCVPIKYRKHSKIMPGGCKVKDCRTLGPGKSEPAQQ